MADISGAAIADFLEEESPFRLTEVDKWVLTQTDETFHLHQWEELKGIIGEQRAAIWSVMVPVNLKFMSERVSILSLIHIIWLQVFKCPFGLTWWHLVTSATRDKTRYVVILVFCVIWYPILMSSSY